ncbi:signal transduction histidine kinase [Streptomyces sp. LBL]|uniref:sensor histidine kinase n=1 Tax=Streptomyces sp. LBL TaxID=2940562 RepID=UPI002473AF6E|nr:sensor histidine kinase [Streptomyces sp. LBL]MDH6625401.1 signal transduction histidine kinase [Streptomyces sp. LBL]
MSTPWRGRLESHPREVDITVALALFVFSAAGSVFSSNTLDARLPIWPTVLLSALSSATLLRRRSNPRTVVAVTALCALVEGAQGYLLSPLDQAPLMAALYSLGLLTDRRTTRTYATLTMLLLVATALLASPDGYGTFMLTAVNPVAWVLLPAVGGGAVQLRRAYVDAVHDRAEHAERTREEEARHRVAQERMRIARELHDVVAHHLALANAQAGTAAHLVRTRPDQAGAMLDNLAQTTAAALREMKTTVGLLRQDNDQDNDIDLPMSPAPGLARLAELTTAFAAAGLNVSTDVEGEPRPLHPGADLSAYRIVQEALTNVTKHSAGRTARVHLRYSWDRLTLTVSNDGAAATAGPATGRGFGLVGMRERAQSVGGTFSAGPRPGGGFEVTGTLPLPPQQSERNGAT